MNPLPHGPEWEFELLERYDQVISQTAAEFGLDTYPNQIEIITSEQMLDAYATSGLPVGYPHWSYGKEFIRNEQAYRRGMQGLAYEIVINSNPCIAYLMEENTMATQALVIAHARRDDEGVRAALAQHTLGLGVEGCSLGIPDEP